MILTFPKPKRPIRVQPNATANRPAHVSDGQYQQRSQPVNVINDRNLHPSQQVDMVQPDLASPTNDAPDNSQHMQISNVAQDLVSHPFGQSPLGGPVAQSTPQRRGINETSPSQSAIPAPTPASPTPNAVANIDYEDDAIFDTNGAPLPPNVQDGLNQNLSQLDPNVSQHVQLISNLLDSHENSRVQPLTPNPNEVQPIRSVSVLKPPRYD